MHKAVMNPQAGGLLYKHYCKVANMHVTGLSLLNCARRSLSVYYTEEEYIEFGDYSSQFPCSTLQHTARKKLSFGSSSHHQNNLGTLWR